MFSLHSDYHVAYNHFQEISRFLMSDFGLQDQEEKVEFSGPLLSQSHRIDELLERHERHIRQAVRRSWFQRGNLL